MVDFHTIWGNTLVKCVFSGDYQQIIFQGDQNIPKKKETRNPNCHQTIEFDTSVYLFFLNFELNIYWNTYRNPFADKTNRIIFIMTFKREWRGDFVNYWLFKTPVTSKSFLQTKQYIHLSKVDIWFKYQLVWFCSNNLQTLYIQCSFKHKIKPY